MNFLNDWECEQCCGGTHCGKCYCCTNYMNELSKKREELVTVLVENIMLSKETGYPEKQGFVYHSAPTTMAFAKAYATDLKRCNKSWRIVTKDNKKDSKIISCWYREGFVPDDKLPACQVDIDRYVHSCGKLAMIKINRECPFWVCEECYKAYLANPYFKEEEFVVCRVRGE